jgi:hypothetical protein
VIPCKRSQNKEDRTVDKQLEPQVDVFAARNSFSIVESPIFVKHISPAHHGAYHKWQSPLLKILHIAVCMLMPDALTQACLDEEWSEVLA